MITMFRSLLCVWMAKNYEGELVLKEYLKFKENTSLMSKSVKKIVTIEDEDTFKALYNITF